MAEDFQQQSWTEVAITVDSKNTETAGNIANMAVPYGIYIEDYSDLVEETLQIAHIDLIDEDLLKKDRTKSIIHIYINPHENPAEAVSFVKERLDAENIPCEISLADCKAQDWVNNWKQYFHAMPIGEKLLIRPEWEKDYDANGRIILNIEPGLAFGTGSHPTTRLCLEMLEEYVNDESTVLDIGCGSGALTIACAKRNPQGKMIGIDRWGKEYASFSLPLCEKNAAVEGVKNASFRRGNAVKLDFPDESFDAVTSNYVYHNIAGKDKQALLLETLRVLKKGGMFAIHDLMSPGRYGDMQAFVQKLRDMGYECVELIDTTDGSFMTPKEAKRLMLRGSTLLLGIK